MCGKAEHVTAYELGMGPGHERGEINAIFGRDAIGGPKIAMGGPSGTGAMGRRAGA